MKKYEKAYRVLKKANKIFYNPDENNPSFTFYEGNKNVIFSCPHAVSQIRKGKEKLADINTGPLGMAINSLGYPVLIKTKNLNDDANYDLKSDYKKFLEKTIKEKGYKFCIDLHELSKRRKIMICLGTNFGKNQDNKLDYSKTFIDIANKNQFPVDLIKVDEPFHAPFRTVSNFIHRHCKISTLEIEINSKVFKSEEQTLSLIKTLDEYAKTIEKKLNKNNPKDLNL